MHEADPFASRPPPHRRSRRQPRPSRRPRQLIPPVPAGLGPAPLTPRRAQVWIREIPRPAPRRPGIWIGSYRVHVLDVIMIVSGIAVLLAIFWAH